MEPDVVQQTHAAGLSGKSTMASLTDELPANIKIITMDDQIRELQTIIRDKNTNRSDFTFYADRLIRLVVEEGLNQLPYSKCSVITPTGCVYEGLKYEKGNCGVSIVRSGMKNEYRLLMCRGVITKMKVVPYQTWWKTILLLKCEAMEQGLRDCCRSIRIGKILIQSDEDTHEAKVVYAKFPDDIHRRKVLLMYPIMSTGNTMIKAVKVLKEHRVQEENIIVLNLFCTPHAAKSVITTFPEMTILTSEIHPVAPNHFGQKYFGTD